MIDLQSWLLAVLLCLQCGIRLATLNGRNQKRLNPFNDYEEMAGPKIPTDNQGP